jgi:hypothetical protein
MRVSGANSTEPTLTFDAAQDAGLWGTTKETRRSQRRTIDILAQQFVIFHSQHWTSAKPFLTITRHVASKFPSCYHNDGDSTPKKQIDGISNRKAIFSFGLAGTLKTTPCQQNELVLIHVQDVYMFQCCSDDRVVFQVLWMPERLFSGKIGGWYAVKICNRVDRKWCERSCSFQNRSCHSKRRTQCNNAPLNHGHSCFQQYLCQSRSLKSR